jgi:hypothetical protein
VVVLECKNTLVPIRIPTSGRLARQRERGEQLETYLRTSQVVEPSGLIRVATPAELPEPDWPSVQRVLVDCQDSDQGFAVITLGAGDYLVACDRRLEEPERLGDVWPGARAAALPALATYSELLRDSGYLTPAPCNYPLPAGLRWALLERELVLFRLVDMAQLDANFKRANVAVSLRTAKADGMFEVQVDSPAVDDFAFSPSLINYCLWAPVPVASMREFLVGYTRRVIGKLMETDDLTCAVPPAVGDQVVYATAYQNNSGRLREPTSAASNNPAPDTVGT